MLAWMCVCMYILTHVSFIAPRSEEGPALTFSFRQNLAIGFLLRLVSSRKTIEGWQLGLFDHSKRLE